MRMKSLFWQIAFRLYNSRQPSIFFEIVTIGFGAFFAAMYFLTVGINPIGPNVVRLLVAVVVVVIGLAHRRVRAERAKGPMALYLKAKVATD